MKRVRYVLLVLLPLVYGGCRDSAEPEEPKEYLVEEVPLFFEGSAIAPVGLSVDLESGARWILSESGDLYRLTRWGQLIWAWGIDDQDWSDVDVCAEPAGTFAPLGRGESLFAGLEARVFAGDAPIPYEEIDGGERFEAPDTSKPAVADVRGVRGPEEEREAIRAIACSLYREHSALRPFSAPESEWRDPLAEIRAPSEEDATWTWRRIPGAAVLASRMVVLPDADALLGLGSLVFRFDSRTWRLEGFADLSPIGVKQIEDLALSVGPGRPLAILDGDAPKLVVVDLETLFGTP